MALNAWRARAHSIVWLVVTFTLVVTALLWWQALRSQAQLREQVLAKIAQEFHGIPPWLPLLGNPFCERYGFAGCSPQGR